MLCHVLKNQCQLNLRTTNCRQLEFKKDCSVHQFVIHFLSELSNICSGKVQLAFLLVNCFGGIWLLTLSQRSFYNILDISLENPSCERSGKNSCLSRISCLQNAIGCILSAIRALTVILSTSYVFYRTQNLQPVQKYLLRI